MKSSTPLSRRTLLRGLGTALSLPMLDAMLPSVARAASTAAIPTRVAWIYVPNGANMADWTPKAEGALHELPMILQPLAAHRRDLTVVSGLANLMGGELGDGGGAHARASASFLTGVHPLKTAGANIRGGISVDQLAASQIGEQTRLPSLELSCDGGQRGGSCDSGYSCAYQFNISWKSETQPMSPEVDPRLAFERLFGNGDPAATLDVATRRKLYRKSVLDYVLDDARRLERRLGSADRKKLDEYLSAVRDLQRRIERAESFGAGKAPPGTIRPGMFATYEEQIQLMMDVLVLAFQTDSTRIATFIIAHDGSNRPYPTIGIRDGHHDLSHHRNDETKKAKLALINRYHASQLARFLDKLRSIREGDGTLLESSTILYGSALSEGNKHFPEDLPILVAGRGGGRVRSGQHLRVPERTPITNLYRSMIETVGASSDKIGDSTGKLEALFAPA